MNLLVIGLSVGIDAPLSSPTPTPRPTLVAVAKLRFSKLSENDEAGCISVQIKGITTTDWYFTIDGIGLKGVFDRGDARVCGLSSDQPVTLTVFNSQGDPVPGGIGVPAKGRALMVGTWR